MQRSTALHMASEFVECPVALKFLTSNSRRLIDTRTHFHAVKSRAACGTQESCRASVNSAVCRASESGLSVSEAAAAGHREIILYATPTGFEPVPSEMSRFRIYRLNHSARAPEDENSGHFRSLPAIHLRFGSKAGRTFFGPLSIHATIDYRSQPTNRMHRL
jgi:hypothetical protein